MVVCPESVTIGEGVPELIEGSASDSAGNTANVRVGPPAIDLTAPQVSVGGVSDGDVFIVGEQPRPICDANDGGSGVAGTCSGVRIGGNDEGVGTYTYTATAADQAGNSGTTVVGYQAVYDTIDGFLSPLGNDQTIVMKAGRAIPVKFRLLDADGNTVVPSATPKWMDPIRSGELSQDPNTAGTDVAATSGNQFKRTGVTFQCNWKTRKDQAGSWWQIGAVLPDGATLTTIVGLRRRRERLAFVLVCGSD
jgi:hypothetical protein